MSKSQEVFCKQQEEKVGQIEKILRDFLPQSVTLQKTIKDAMEYSLMAGGKRIRPLLLMESYYQFGGTNLEEVHPFMVAMEMIHTYSLVHDDLPAMDNDMYRRGRKTTHVVYGEDMGILAGDALLNYAYEVALEGVVSMKDSQKGLQALKILADKAGIYGMVGGQVVDVEETGKPLEASQLDFIYRLKTGALLEAALMMGAVLAGATASEIQTMQQIGTYVGMAFQIQDDLLDVTSTTKTLGKPVGSDARNGKTTYVTLYGEDKAKEAVKQYSTEALALLEKLPGENPFLGQLITSLIYRTK